MSLADDIATLGNQAPAVISSIAKVVKTVGPALSTVRVILEDPAFPQVVARINTLHELEAAQAKPTPAPTPGTGPKPPVPPAAGIGLHRAVPILDAVIYARRNPWAPWAIGAGFLLLVGGIGYRLGRRRSAT